MTLNHDITLHLCTAPSRRSKLWEGREWLWSELAERCSRPAVTAETAAEYAAMSRDRQSDIKDVGGFVAATLRGGARKADCVTARTAVTLDIDYGAADTWERVRAAFPASAALIYTTHKHSAASPRYRLVMPLARPVAPEMYEPLARKVAERVGIDMFDTTTYDTNRLFYWGSRSADAPWEFELQDAPPLDPDTLLAEYADPADPAQWPRAASEAAPRPRAVAKAEDPTAKGGVIGAFCRAHTIEDVLTGMLAHVYEPTADPARFTYREGHTAGGVVCYDGKWAYSHHDTDPAGGRLLNAFDIARVHLHGHLDAGAAPDAPAETLPSYAAMLRAAAADTATAALIMAERAAEAAEDFAPTAPPQPPAADDWKSRLAMTKSGEIKPTAQNILAVLTSDPALAGRTRHNDFTGFDEADGLPWDPRPHAWTDTDDAQLRVYMEKAYGITGREKIADCLAVVMGRRAYHPVRDYLDSLRWDGVGRVATMLTRYLGAADTEYTRAVARMHMAASVARIYEPGCKYDHCLLLAGPEGTGKSSLIAILGGEWFSDSLTTTEGKEGMDCLRGVWLAELSELAGVRRSEVEQIKAYISRQTDIYRAAYARRVTQHPRQNTFWASTNEDNPLRGDTGNRRFLIVDAPGSGGPARWADTLRAERDQLWAEAVALYRGGHKLYLPAHIECQAREIQRERNDDADDPMLPLLRRFLDMRLPRTWDTYDLAQRREWLRDPDCQLAEAGTEPRARVCAAEFLCEMMRKEIADKDFKHYARKVGKALDEMPGWERVSLSRHAERLYGRQRSFSRVNSTEEDDL